MTKESEDLMVAWLNKFPESTHELDRNRMYNFAISLAQNRETVDAEEIESCFMNYHPEYNEQRAHELSEKWDSELTLLVEAYRYLLDKE